MVRGQEPKEEVQIYTWKDATLRELTDLVGSQSMAVALLVVKCFVGGAFGPVIS